MGTKNAILRLVGWGALAFIFNMGIYFFMGQQKAIEFFGGYVIEQSLSIDNLFLFLLIFKSFGIQERFQKRILKYGILGAVVLRLVFIILGVSIVNRFHWMLYFFGAVLIISGVKMFIGNDQSINFKETFLYRSLRKIIPITDKVQGERFFVHMNRRLYATPLFAVLVIIEGSDIIFALDSIPAVFSITTDLFIVYTSNIFAIMGLRSMYFLLEKLHKAFKLVKYGVALILMFTGIKLLVSFMNIEIPIGMSIMIIFSILILSTSLSVLVKDE